MKKAFWKIKTEFQIILSSLFEKLFEMERKPYLRPLFWQKSTPYRILSNLKFWRRCKSLLLVIFQVCKWHMGITLSTSRKTLKKLSPANFFKSSMVHMPLASRVANNSGYCETSSKPRGVLKITKTCSKLPIKWPNLRHTTYSKFSLCLLWLLSFSEKRATFLRQNYPSLHFLFLKNICFLKSGNFVKASLQSK